jgi:hypothetical protein
MNAAQVFSYSLLIKSPERTEKILALLDDNKREEVMNVIAGLQGLSAEDLRRIWHEQRKAEEIMAREAIRERAGANLERWSSRLAEWVARKT